MNRQAQMEEYSQSIKRFIEKNPSLKEALETFEISNEQYKKAVEIPVSYRLDSSTNKTND